MEPLVLLKLNNLTFSILILLQLNKTSTAIGVVSSNFDLEVVLFEGWMWEMLKGIVGMPRRRRVLQSCLLQRQVLTDR